MTSPRKVVWWVLLLVVASSCVTGGELFDGTPPPMHASDADTLTNPFNIPMDEKHHWYIGDHPFFYLMDKVRAPNGSWVPNPNASIPPFTIEEWRNHTMERVPWWIRWYVTGETRELRKQMLAKRAFIIDHVVSPMDYGRSLRAQSVRAQWHEQVRHFWMGALGRKVFQNLKHNLEHLVLGGFQEYMDMEMYRRKFGPMNSTEWGLYMNMTMDEIDQVRDAVKEDIRDKLTRPYRYKIPAELTELAQKNMRDVRLMVQYFQPYPNYTGIYYNAEEDLPPPTMPAATDYPWPWTERIAQVRATLVEVMRIETARSSLDTAIGNDTVHINGLEASQETSEASIPAQRKLQLSAHDSRSSSLDSDGDVTNDGSLNGIATLDEASKEAAIQQLQLLAKEFHFMSGIPRIDLMQDRYEAVAFPSFHQFLNLSIDANGSASIVPGERFSTHASDPEAGVPPSPQGPTHLANLSAMTESLPDYTSREGVYAAARHFYSFATVQGGYIQAKDYFKPATQAPKLPTDGTILVDDLTPIEKVELLDCSTDSPGMARSGITVYTPKVASAVVDIFKNTDASTPAASSQQRLKRQDWVMNIFQGAFDAELRVINSGLAAPSTVWNSYFDRNTDIFADKVFGLVNGSKALATDSGMQWEAREIFEALMDNSSSPLIVGYSYFRLVSSATNSAMYIEKTVPTLVPFTSEQLVYLIGFLMELMREMQTAIEQFQHKRDSDPMHIAIVNATQQQVYYDGRLFGVLGYGYFLPATNSHNVAYRDHKIPVPFHLIMRVMIRLQESHLLLPDEAVHIAACLAMLQFDVRYYRCTVLSADEKATPKPMLEDSTKPITPEADMKTSPSSNTPAVSPRAAPQAVSLDWP